VQNPALMLLWQCSPLHSGTPLYPVVQQLQQAGQSEPSLETRLGEAGVPEATRGWVLRLAGAAAQQPTGLDPSVEKTNTLYAVVEALQALSARQPVLLLLEDAHWIDPSTEELLALAVQQLRAHRVLLVVTSRPGYEPAWQQAPNLTRLALSRLAQRQSLQLAQEVASEVARSVMGHWSLPRELLEQIVKRTDGVPLFVEELTKAVLEAGLPQELQQGWQGEGIAKLAIPTTLQDSLTARLDRLQPGTREVAQAASVIGREFSQAVLCEALKPMGEVQVTQALQELQKAELVYLRQGVQPVAGGGADKVSGVGSAGTTSTSGTGGLGSFKHALVRDAAYGSLLKAQRAQWHAKVARALETVEPQVVQQQPQLLAGHRQQAGELAEALELWRKAGDLAFSRSSLVEAAEHYRAAIALCPQVQPEPAVEFHLQLQLAVVLTQTQGYGSEEGLAAARRAFELTSTGDLRDQRFEAARALGTSLVSRGAITQADESVSACLATRPDDPNASYDMLGATSCHWVLGASSQLAGRCHDARSRLVQCLEVLESCPNDDAVTTWGGAHPRVAVLLWLERTLMYSGLLEQGMRLNERALAIARSTGHPPSLTWALLGMISWLNLAGRHTEADALVQQGADIAERFQIKPRIAGFRLIQGRNLIALGKPREGAALMRSGVDLWLESSSVMTATLMITTPASAMASVGDVQAVQEYLDIGDRLMRETEERIGQAELLRLRAWVCRKQGDAVAARSALESALSVARQQGARYFELRAALDLIKLTDGKAHEAAAVAELHRVYSGFTEGFDFPVLKNARKILEAGGARLPILATVNPLPG